MVTAFILVNTKSQTINETAQALVEMEEVAEVHSVAGPWDLVVVIRVKKNEQLASVVTEKILKIEGVENTTTLIAFRAFSRHDLERLFSVGFEE